MTPAHDETVLTVYTTSWCPYCERLRDQLVARGVRFTEIDVDADADAARFVESVNGGNRVVPTVLYPDGSTATNPRGDVVVRTLQRLTAS